MTIWVPSCGVTSPPALFLRHRSLLNEAFLEQDVPGIGFIRPGYFLFKKATALIGHLVPMALHPGKLLSTHVFVVKPEDRQIHCDDATKKVQVSEMQKIVPQHQVEQYPVSTMQKTGWAIHSSFLVLSGLEKGSTLDVKGCEELKNGNF